MLEHRAVRCAGCVRIVHGVDHIHGFVHVQERGHGHGADQVHDHADHVQVTNLNADADRVVSASTRTNWPHLLMARPCQAILDGFRREKASGALFVLKFGARAHSS